MAFERVKLFGIIELDVEATAAGTLKLYTNLPGTALALRATLTVPITSRRPVRFRLSGAVKGHLLQVSYDPGAAGVSRLYGARVWARELPEGRWGWYSLPVVPTPDQFVTMRLPVPPTPEEWRQVQIPIPPTPEQWTRVELPVKPTPLVPDWVELEMDQ